MVRNDCICPRCRQPLQVVYGYCYSWTAVFTGESILVLETEPLYRCDRCVELHFPEELIPSNFVGGNRSGKPLAA